jgi:fumarate reductase subunit C
VNVRLYLLQRGTAALMLPLVIGHIAIIFYATRKGLSAAEVLGRTRGSIAWGLYYGLFVVAAAVHAAIGVRTVAMEWARLKPATADIVMWSFGGLLMLLGLRAVLAVTLP